MQLEMLRPWWLAGLLLLPVLFWYWNRTLVHLPVWQRMLSLALRALVIFFVVAAIAGLQHRSQSQQPFVAFVVDQSASITPEAREYAAEYLRKATAAAPRGTTSAVGFVSRAGYVTDDVRLPLAVPGMPAETLPLAAEGTDARQALLCARAAIPGDCVPAMVLMSDGWVAGTRRVPLQIMQESEVRSQESGEKRSPPAPLSQVARGEGGIPIHVVPLPAPKSEVWIERIAFERFDVRPGEPLAVTVDVYSLGDNSGRVQLLRGAEVVGEQAADVRAGTTSVKVSGTLASGGERVPLTVRLTDFADAVAENNVMQTGVFLLPKYKVLLVEGTPRAGEHLAKALRENHFDVDAREPGRLPAAPDGLAAYDLVALVDVPAQALPAAAMDSLAKYVEQGGGLVAIGGPQSFTAGGYKGTKLEQVLPVISEPRADKPKPVVALVLVLDVSASMDEGGAIGLARQAARVGIERLAATDLAGVLAFSDDAKWITELKPVGDKQAMLAEMDKIRPVGRTNMYPAIEKAFLALKDSFADVKHMIVMTDGLCDPGDFHGQAKRIAAAGVTMSTVGVGNEAAQTLLGDMAAAGGGQFYFCQDAKSMPRVFAMEAAKVTKVGVSEEPFTAAAGDAAEMLAGIDTSKLPTLLGYVETRAQPKASVLLAAGRADQPLLAYAKIGQGRSVAFTSDVQPRWANRWLRWPQFAKFWTQVASGTLRRTPSAVYVLQDGEPLKAHVAGESAATGEAVLSDRTPVVVNDDGDESLDPDKGYFTITTGKQGPQPARVVGFSAARAWLRGEVRLADGRTMMAYAVTSPPVSAELRIQPPNTDYLRQIAAESGGKYAPQPADLFAPDGRTAPRTTLWWPWLLSAALVVFVADVASRRLQVGKLG